MGMAGISDSEAGWKFMSGAAAGASGTCGGVETVGSKERDVVTPSQSQRVKLVKRRIHVEKEIGTRYTTYHLGRKVLAHSHCQHLAAH